MADAYEQQEMPGVGRMLLRRKVSTPGWLLGVSAGIPSALGVLAGAGLLAVGPLWPGLAVLGLSLGFGALITFLHLTFATARLAISEGEVHVQLGFAGPKIPIAEIERVSIAPTGQNRIGMGVGRDLQGHTTFRLWGDNARAVHIQKTNGKKVVLQIKDPDGIAQAIQEALDRHAAKRPQVRVATEEEPGIEESESVRAARARRASHP